MASRVGEREIWKVGLPSGRRLGNHRCHEGSMQMDGGTVVWGGDGMSNERAGKRLSKQVSNERDVQG